MEVQTMLSMHPTAATRSVLVTQDSPRRVFVLSNRRLLREALVRVLKNQTNISFVRAEEFSLNAIAEVVESNCDALLVDPVNKVVLYAQILDQLPNTLPHLRIITLDMDTNIDALLSEVFASSSICHD